MKQAFELKTIRAGVVEVAFREDGRRDGKPVILLHGFPYDIHAYADVIPLLAAQGCYVITPFLRGYGETRFVSPDIPRSGQQAALASDLLALMDALALPSAAVAGFDWGGRTACIAAALWPERVTGLVSDGYSIQHIASSATPQPPEVEHRYWYQYYFHSERGRAGLATYRRELCKQLWRAWSPNWAFDDATFARSAAAFDNPDFVEVVIHSYRHRFGLAGGDLAFEPLERRLATLPTISVPSISLHGGGDVVTPPELSAHDQPYYTGFYESRVIPSIGHNVPQEAPREFADAILALLSRF